MLQVALQYRHACWLQMTLGQRVCPDRHADCMRNHIIHRGFMEETIFKGTGRWRGKRKCVLVPQVEEQKRQREGQQWEGEEQQAFEEEVAAR